MPGLMTHYLFGKDACGYIYDDRIKNTILKHKNAYDLGLQGADFYFYDLSHSVKCKGFNYGRLIHTNQTSAFFANCLKAASMLSGTKREIALAYIYGFLCHFALDSTVHPYILYMACFKTDTEDERILSSTSHTYFETVIDTQMLLLKRGLAPNQLRRQDVIDISRSELHIISQVISYAFNKTFHQYTTSKSVANSIRNFRLMNIFLQDESTLKLKVLQNFEKNMAKASLISGIMYSKTARIKWDVLNRNNTAWCLPWNSDVVSHDSFLDLYDKAALFASKLINDADSIINFDMKPDDFLNKIGNRSYITGLECNEPCVMKHFRSRTRDIVS